MNHVIDLFEAAKIAARDDQQNASGMFWYSTLLRLTTRLVGVFSWPRYGTSAYPAHSYALSASYTPVRAVATLSMDIFRIGYRSPAASGKVSH